MKKAFNNLSELNKMLLIASIVSLVLILGSIVGIFFNQPGWIIGVVSGSCIELINIILLYKGSSEILKNEKPALFLLFYALRMILFVGLILILVLLQYKANLDIFKWSFVGALIGYTPMQIVVIVVTLIHRGDSKNG